jgi:hypothetical protein
VGRAKFPWYTILWKSCKDIDEDFVSKIIDWGWDEDELHYDFYHPWRKNEPLNFAGARVTEYVDELSAPTYFRTSSHVINAFPDIPFVENSTSIISNKLVKSFEALGFNDFRTYPVRVYVVPDFRSRYLKNDALLASDFPYYDDLYVVFQLTKPPFNVFSGSSEDASSISLGDGKYLSADYETREYPMIFQTPESFIYLCCNTYAATELKKNDEIKIKII